MSCRGLNYLDLTDLNLSLDGEGVVAVVVASVDVETDGVVGVAQNDAHSDCDGLLASVADGFATSYRLRHAPTSSDLCDAGARLQDG